MQVDLTVLQAKVCPLSGLSGLNGPVLVYTYSLCPVYIMHTLGSNMALAEFYSGYFMVKAISYTPRSDYIPIISALLYFLQK